APLACTLACIIVTHPAHLIALPVLEPHLAVRAELFVIRDARSTDREKSHDGLLYRCVVVEQGHTAGRVSDCHAACRDPAHRGGKARCAPRAAGSSAALGDRTDSRLPFHGSWAADAVRDESRP